MIDDIRNLVLSKCDEGEHTLNQILATAPHLLRVAVDCLPFAFTWPDSVKDHIVALLMTHVRAAVLYGRASIVVIRMMANALGSPDDLDATAATLASAVNNPSVKLGQAIGSAKLQALFQENWDSAGRDHYQSAVDIQTAAVGRIQEISKVLETALSELSNALIGFGNAILIAVVAYLAGAVVLIATVATGPGVIAGVVAFIAGVVTAGVSLGVSWSDSTRTADAQTAALTGTATLTKWTPVHFAH